MPQAIAALSRQAGVSIGSDEPLPPVLSRPVHGKVTVPEALGRMLEGTGFAARRVGPRAWRLEHVALAHNRRSSGDSVQESVRPAPEAIDPSPIIVTATKRALSISELPRSISVLQFDESNRQDPALGTSAMASEMDGLSMTALGPGRNRMFLRGVADSPFNGSSQATVGVLLDDTRITYSAPDPDLRLVDVDRVEVLKGPQGSLYGTGVLGGVYRIVTNRPDLGQFGASASAGIVTVSSGGIGADASATLNLPVIQNRVGLRLVGYEATEPGWIDTGPRRDSNSSRVVGGRMALAVNFSDGWRLVLSGLTQQLEARDSQYTFQPESLVRPAQNAEPHESDLSMGAARLSGRIGNVDAMLVSGISWHEVNDTLDATIGAQSFGLANPELFQDDRSYRVWDTEMRLSGSLGGAAWLAGISHVEARESERRSLDSAPPLETLQIDTSQRNASDTGVFGNIAIPVARRWKLEGGARLYFSSVEDQTATTAGSFSQAATRIGVSPSATLAWQPTSRRLVYVQYGSAFRPGGIDIDANGSAEAFAGDKLETVELGWREQFAARGQLDLSAFYTWWNDFQSDMLLRNGLVETRNAGVARIAGVEASLQLSPWRNWGLSFGGTFENAVLVQNRLGIALEDRRLPVIPEYTLRNALSYQFRIGRLTGTARLSLRYIGPARLSFDPLLDRPMGNVLESGFESELSIGNTSLHIKLDNLTGAAADSFAFGNPFRQSTPQYTPQRPFSASISLVHRF